MTTGMRRFLFIVILLSWVIALMISPTSTTLFIGGVAFALLLMNGRSSKKQVSEALLHAKPESEGE